MRYVSNKKQKLQRLDNLTNVLKDAIDDKEKTNEQDQRQKMEIHHYREQSENREINETSLAKVKICKKIVKETLQEYHEWSIDETGVYLDCNVCLENYEKASLVKNQIKSQIKISKNIKGHVERHEIENKSHRQCLRAKDSYQVNQKYYEEAFRNQALKIEKMTDNIIRVIYFIVKENVAMLKSESLFLLLDLCEALIGNQLHSRKTGAAVALCIDEVHQTKFSNFLIGDKCEEFTFVGDEMTDCGGIKTLISKFRTFEGMELREFVYSIIESSGTSEEMNDKFCEDLMKQMNELCGLDEEEVEEFFKNKLRASGSDRASKMLKFVRLMSDEIECFNQYNCDCHITESAYAILQNNKSVENAEKLVKQAYKMQSQSSSRKLKLQNLAEKYEQKNKKLQNIIDIKFATYNAEACDATLIDFEPVTKLAMNLRNDTSVKPKMRAKLRNLYNRCRDQRNLLNLVALSNVVQEIAKYQKWAQKEKASAFERKYKRNELERNLNKINNLKAVEKSVEKYCKFVDWENNQMKKSKIQMTHAKTKEKAIKHILTQQKKFSQTFIDAKSQIHDEEDPDFLDDLSDIFDIRLWNLVPFLDDDFGADPNIKETIEEEKERKQDAFDTFIQKFADKIDSECAKQFYSDFETEIVLSQMRDIMLIIKQAQIDGRGCLERASQKDHIIDQWKELARFLPEIIPKNDHYVFYRLVKRAALACDSQSGCERANSIYNIFKNDLSSVMKLPMVSARLRIHQNGPPLSKFNPLPVRQLWLRKGHQMAATVAEKKLVIERIKQEDAEYTSHIFD